MSHKKIKVRDTDLTFGDTISKLPLLSASFHEIGKILKYSGSLGIIVVDIFRYVQVEEIFGWEVIDKFIKICSDSLMELRETYQNASLIPVVKTPGDDFIVFCVGEETQQKFDSGVLIDIVFEIDKKVMNNLKKAFSDKYFHEIGLRIGYATVESQPKIRLERLINKAVKDAYINLYERSTKDHIKTVSRIKNLIEQNKFINFFQPIVNLNDFSIFGYEALLRIKDEAKVESPLLLLNISIKEGLIFEVERIVKESAIETMRKLGGDYKLFLNFEACVLEDFHKTLAIFDKSGFSYGRVVIELTERTAVTSFEKLQKSISFLRAKGFQFAIDDAGSGYASMESIAYLKPEYLKIDLSIVRDINSNYIKQDIVLSLSELAKRTGSILLAEGIEKEAEYKTLLKMGVHFGQGYFFAHPTKEPVKKISLK